MKKLLSVEESNTAQCKAEVKSSLSQMQRGPRLAALSGLGLSRVAEVVF
jgi:hypothetical protein